MQSVEQGRLISGRGLEGDRYCRQNGTYSVLRLSSLRPGEREPGRQLTLISWDSVHSVFAQVPLKPLEHGYGDLRRNILVKGLSSQDLLGAVGCVVRLGDTCQILVHRHCVPCQYNERKNGVPGLMEAIWDHSGVSTEVLVGGAIRVGDKVEILDQQKMAVDAGIQAPGYYIPPKQRTAQMVKDARAAVGKHKKELMEFDREGVERVDKSYASVGLKFWPSTPEQ